MRTTNTTFQPRKATALALTLVLAGAVACTKKAPTETAPPEAPATADAHAGHDHAAATTSGVEPRVAFLEPADGATVGQKFKVRMNVEGYEIGPLGDLTKGKGHHHIVVNGSWIKDGEIVPTDEKLIHFGKGQTETELELKPGKYSLTLQFADGAHRSYGEQLSQTINVTVQ